MAEIPSVYKLILLCALIACNAFIWAEGRQMKSMNKKEDSAVKKESQRKTAEGCRINLHQTPADCKEDFHPSQPSRDGEHSIAGKKETFPPISFGDVATVYKDDFRPTTLGNSPGVGHKRGKEEEDDFRPTTPGNSPGVGHKYGKEEEDDFRPSTPGNSPGVGHKYGKEEEDDFRPRTPGNSPGVGHEHGKEEEDDFRPTTPGNSPGVGHKHSEEEEDVESKVQGHHSLAAGQSFTIFPNDSRPSAPGHSPGVGHHLSNKKAEPKA